jgi:hypothetical protein
MVAGTFQRTWRWAIWTAIAWTIVNSLAMDLLLLFICSPTEAYWRGGYDANFKQEWHCGDAMWSNYAAGIFALGSDFYAVCLPAVMLWPIQMPSRQKMALNALFAAGSITVVAAAFRTKALIEMGKSSDLAW